MRGQNLVDHVLGKAKDADAGGSCHKMVDMKVDAFEVCPILRLSLTSSLEFEPSKYNCVMWYSFIILVVTSDSYKD